MSKDKIGDRMKSQYENRTKQFLTRRLPTIIRLDGKAFHTYTRGLKKPFDEGLIQDMVGTTKHLCENIQGCVLGYTQSDEITLVLTDYKKLTSQAWFDYNVQKMTSISASIATAIFNQLRLKRIFEEEWDNQREKQNHNDVGSSNLAYFDSRVFQIPEKEEVVNSLIWRQQDATRNSIQMLAQSLFSHSELHKKNTSELQEMCFKRGYNWNDLSFDKKRGSFIIKNTYVNGILIENIDFHEISFNDNIRNKWESVETPIFSKERNSILKLI